MREIKFRGREQYGNRWTFGFYVQGEMMNASTGETSVRHMIESYGHRIDIDPKTIGQYTGLKDKNGVEIYEGDIVNRYESIYGGRTVVGRVRYAQETCQFSFLEDYKYAKDESLTLVGKRAYERDYYDVEYKYEVIGNIHDNPELLGS